MTGFVIKRAERTQARLRLGMVAPSGGGKTWTSLLLAKGIVDGLLEAGLLTGTIEGKIGVIDTERRSAQLYSHLLAFDTIELDPPYTVDRYCGALQQFENAGYAVVILDQISHAWMGQGGIMEKVNQAQSKNAMAPWLDATPEQNRLVDSMLGSTCHIIATMRAKTAWALEEKENRAGRLVKVPKRIGVGIVQRPGIEYEFTTVLSLATDTHIASPIKDRTNLFPEDGAVIDETWGRRMVTWMLSAKTPDEAVTVRGTPLERLTALQVTGIARMEGAANVPDLARVYYDVVKSMRVLAPSVEETEYRPLIEGLEAAKNVRKAAMGGGLAPRQDEVVSTGYVPGPATSSGGGSSQFFEDMGDDIPY